VGAGGLKGDVRPRGAVGVAPTNDGLTMVTVNWPRTEFDANRRDVEGAFARAFALVPEFAERLQAATRETRIVGTGDLPNFFRKPYGPGWARQAAMDGFVSVIAGTVPVPEFFGPENTERIMAGAATDAPGGGRTAE
jgi:hypothetical protein